MGTPGFLIYLNHKFNLFSGDERSILVKKNIYFSFLIKGFSISISLLLVPLTLNYLSVYEFGVWLTLSSIFTWINYFDIGLGNGLRNRLAESMAKNDKKLGQIYVSTTFFILSLIVTVVFLIFLAFQPYLNWAEILNADPEKVANLNKVIVLSFAFFCLNFLFKIIGIIYAAAQKPAFNDLITFLGSLLSLIIIFILTKTTEGTLMNVAVVFSAAPTVILLVAYPITFFGYFKDFRPKISAIKPYYAKDLMNLGFQFFVLQISGLLIFGTSNIIISRILGPEQVAPYNIAFKYFSIATMVFNIIIAPMWSASTDAFAKGDLLWIKKYMQGMLKVSILSTIGVVVLILTSNIAYHLWIGTAVIIPFKLSIWMGIYTIVVLWSTCFSTFLFGIGKLRIQLINTVIASCLFIPLALWLSKSLGITGIVIALCITNLSGAILNPLQYKKIISGKASGIWDK
ncbi:MAG: oligosaccharide flippase family protein [Mariniphaga sp.]|nr:oligosaccharide flippase family protein [Mariniphaga sp.]